MSLAGGGSKSSNIPKRRMSRVAFDDSMDPSPDPHGYHDMKQGDGVESDGGSNYFLDDGNVTIMRQPYAVLRLVRGTIESGGFLSPKLYIPNSVWKQFGVKLAGLNVKTSAIEQLILLIEFHFESLCYPLDEGDQEGFATVSHHMQTFLKEICVLQNSLSKPFPFIREVASDPLLGIVASNPIEKSNNGGAGNSISGMASNMRNDPSTAPNDAQPDLNVNSNLNSTEKAAIPVAAASAPVQGNKWTSLVAGFGKSVVKYAEVSYQRLGAMTTRISDEEFNAYTVLLLVLCEKCQILDKWHGFLEKERGKASINRGPNIGTKSGVSSLFPAVDNDADNDSHWNQAIESLLINMISVSMCIQEVFCEIILRDIDILTKRYMRKMRKSFSIMHWDDPDEFELDT